MGEPKPDQGATPRRVGVREFRGNMTSFLRKAQQGASFLITSHNEVVAEIRPPSKVALLPREFGTMRGQIWMADDFDTLPDDILDAMEGKSDCDGKLD